MAARGQEAVRVEHRRQSKTPVAAVVVSMFIAALVPWGFVLPLTNDATALQPSGFVDAAVSVWQHRDPGSADWNIAYSVLGRGPGDVLDWYSLHATNKATLVADLAGSDRRPNIGYDWDGARAMAVWDHDVGDGTTDVWYSLYRGVVLGWTAPAPVATVPGNDVDPAVAFDQDHSAMVVWTRETAPGFWQMFYSKFDGTSSFTAAAAVTASPLGDASLPEIAFTIHAATGGGHKALVAWVDRASPTLELVYYSIWDAGAWASAAAIPNQAANGMPNVGSGRESFSRIGISTDVAGDSFVGWGGHVEETSPGSVSVSSPGVTGAKWDGTAWTYPLATTFFGVSGCHTPAVAADIDLNSVMVFPFAGSEEYSRRVGNTFTYESIFDSGPLNDLRPGLVSVGEEFATVYWGLDGSNLDGAEVWWNSGIPDPNNANVVNWATPSRVETVLAGGMLGEDRYPEIDSILGGRTRPLFCSESETVVDSPLPNNRYIEGVGYATPGLPVPEVFGSPLPVEFHFTILGDITSVKVHLDTPLNVVYGPVSAPSIPDPVSFSLVTTGLSEGLHVLTITGRLAGGCVLPPVNIPFIVATPSMSAAAIGAFVATTTPVAPELESVGAFLPNSKTSSSSARTTLHVDLPTQLGGGYVESMDHFVEGTLAAGPTFTSLSDVRVGEFELLGGVVKGKALHGVVTAGLDVVAQTASVSSAGTQFVELEVASTPFSQNVPTNTVVPLPVPFQGRVVLNEELTYTGTGYAERVLNMVHVFVVLPGSASEIEIILGQAQAGASFGSTFVGPSRDVYIHNDAGTGADVGGTLATAHPLAAPFALVGGRLVGTDTTDVYSVTAAHGEKVFAVVKPAEHAEVGLHPIRVDATNFFVPSPPLPVTPPVNSVTTPTTSTFLPNIRLELVSPLGAIRETSQLPLSAPQKVELNVDNADPGPWYLRLSTTQSPETSHYTLEVHVVPIVLFDQIDGQTGTTALPPHDATSACPAASIQLPNGVPTPGVLRDDDYVDIFLLPPAQLGDTVKVTMKPEEGTDGADFDLFLRDPECVPVPASVITVGGQLSRGESTLGKDIVVEGAVPKGVPDLVFDMPVQKEGIYRAEVRRINGVGNYYIEALVHTPIPTLPLDDAASGNPTTPFAENDASDVCTAALPLLVLPNGDPFVGPYEGTFRTRADNYDHYVFPAVAGDRITITLVPSSFSSIDGRLYTANCGTLLDAGTLPQLGLNGPSLPETMAFDAPATGLYVLQVQRLSGGGNYLFSVTDERLPGPNPPLFNQYVPEPPGDVVKLRHDTVSEEELSLISDEFVHDVTCAVGFAPASEQ